MTPDRKNCPHCGRDLSYEVNGKQYSHATLVEIRGVYDGGLFYADAQGGGCHRAWHRWSEGHPLWEKAEPYVNDWNAQFKSDTQPGSD